MRVYKYYSTVVTLYYYVIVYSNNMDRIPRIVIDKHYDRGLANRAFTVNHFYAFTSLTIYLGMIHVYFLFSDFYFAKY